MKHISKGFAPPQKKTTNKQKNKQNNIWWDVAKKDVDLKEG